MRLTLVRTARRPIRTSSSVPRQLGSKRSDRHLAASRVALVPAALAWPARLAHRNPASTRRDSLPDLPHHRLVSGRRPHRSLPGRPAHIACALWRSHRRPSGSTAVAHRHPDRSRGLLGRARDRDSARVRERGLPLRVHRHRRGLLRPRRSRPRSAHADPRAARAAARGDGAEPSPLPDRVHRRSGDGRCRHPHLRGRRPVAAWGPAHAAFGLMNDALLLPPLVFIAVEQRAGTVSAIFRGRTLLTVVPDHLRGRLVAISWMFFLGGPYLGQVESGVVADLVSPTFSVVSGGIATLFSVVGVALWAPEVLSYRAPAPELKGTSPDA